jgi:FKBP-type peptidyl-prolyl cis-trans isomerase SlpA
MSEQLLEIAPGSEVTLHLSLSTTDGFEALSTFGEEPETLVMGDGTLSEGLELALYGLKPGDAQTLTLTAEQSFGEWDKNNIHRLPRHDFISEEELEPGLVIGFSAAEGEELAGTILEVDQTTVMVDFNHPLAGREVIFRVEILEVKGPELTASKDN